MKADNKGYNSVYRGIVVSTQDDFGLGRIRVRIPFLHGTTTYNNTKCISDDKLPYAYPCSILASQDAGMFLLPEVGSMVFILFENGDPSKPIYIGQMFSQAIDNRVFYTSPNTRAFKDSDNLRVKKAFVKDTPQGTYDNGVFRKYTLLKTPKGSTIEFDDTDEQERLCLFDRLGQSFVMYSPTTEEYSQQGINTRGVFNTIKDKFNRTIELASILLLKALSGSFLRIVSKSKSSTTDLVTVYKDDTAGIHIDIGDDNRLLIFYKNNKIELTDRTITLKSTDSINIDAKTINLNADIINTTTDIYVADTIEETLVKDYKNTKDEEAIN